MLLREIFGLGTLCLIHILLCTMAALDPYDHYIQAANKLLDFGVREIDYLPDPWEENDDEVDTSGIDLNEDFMDIMFKNVRNYTADGHRDSKHIAEINKLLPDIVDTTVRRMNGGNNTRRTWWWWQMPDYWYDGYVDSNTSTIVTEEYKQKLIIKLCLAWFLNARRFIYQALDMRKPIMEDKRYKIGFLFHALRMNVFDQHKLLQGMQQQEGDKQLRNFDSNFLIFNKILRLNVDMNDVISYIRLLHYHQPDLLLKSMWDYQQRQKRPYKSDTD